MKIENQKVNGFDKKYGESVPDQSGEKGMDNQERSRRDFEDLPVTQPTAGAKITLGIFGMICLAAFGIYWLTVSAWLYQAADKIGFHGFLWFLLALIGNLFAVILFVLVRSILCSKCDGCGRWQDRKNKYCISCGTAMFDSCPDCEAIYRNGTLYCSNCGRKLYDTGEARD
ncbi:zinc ribbon domain-containing protein [Solibaculum mannosilyticum]|uniref:zinc ribbon domain-containing protein n=1 Tax=Solibaculum mannosilyticum TaxID=2780922 RepID=UPI001BFFDF4F|nr:zinc ribbon domain-containing protein [Solibaculum mannosilyticum]